MGSASSRSWGTLRAIRWRSAVPGTRFLRAPRKPSRPVSGSSGNTRAATHAAPQLGQFVDGLQGRPVRCDERAVDGADRRADDQVGPHVALEQRAKHADLNGAEAGASGEHERDAHATRGSRCRGPVRIPRWRPATPVSYVAGAELRHGRRPSHIWRPHSWRRPWNAVPYTRRPEPAISLVVADCADQMRRPWSQSAARQLAGAPAIRVVVPACAAQVSIGPAIPSRAFPAPSASAISSSSCARTQV